MTQIKVPNTSSVTPVRNIVEERRRSGQRPHAGKQQGFVVGRIIGFENLLEEEIASLASALRLSVVELDQRRLSDGRSVIRALEMLVDDDVCRRLVRENMPMAREIAKEQLKIVVRIASFAEYTSSLVLDIVGGSTISAAGVVARMRLLSSGTHALARDANRISMAALVDAMALDAEAKTEGRPRSREEDVAFGALADILREIGLGLEVRQDSELATGGGAFYDACLDLSAIVLARLERASMEERIPGAGVAADRLRRFLALKPPTIAKRIRQARVGGSEQIKAGTRH